MALPLPRPGAHAAAGFFSLGVPACLQLDSSAAKEGGGACAVNRRAAAIAAVAAADITNAKVVFIIIIGFVLWGLKLRRSAAIATPRLVEPPSTRHCCCTGARIRTRRRACAAE